MMTTVKNWVTRWAGIQPSYDRAHIVAPLQDADKDFTSNDRAEFAAKVRQMERGDAMINRVLDLHDIYVFGASGINIKSASEDREWSALANRIFADWTERPDVGSKSPWAQIQKLIGGSWGLDGGAFVILTTERAGDFHRPRIQLIEDHRCATPSNEAAQGRRIVDGIELEPMTNRPLAYWFSYRDGDENKWRRVDADMVVHISDPRRIGQLRAPSIFYPVINDIQDLAEWQGFVKLKLKDTAETSKVLYTKDGAKGMEHLKARFADASVSAAAGETIDARMGKLRAIMGARTVNLTSSDKYEEFRSDQPADTSQRFWEIVARKACAGVNLPYEVVFPTSIQGTMARAVFDMAHAQFKGLQSMFAVHFFRIWRHVIQVEAQYNPRLADFPADWKRMTYTGPRAINVDIGYNSRAAIDETRAGLRTYHEGYDSKGQDFDIAMRQNAEALSKARELEIEYNLPAGSLTGTGEQTQPMPMQEGEGKQEASNPWLT